MYFSVSSFLLILCVCFYVLGKTLPFLCLEGVVYVEDETYLLTLN